MDRLTHILFCFFTISSIMVCGIVPVKAQQRLKHPGRVVDMKTGQPSAVDVKAWPEAKKTGEEGGCPLYGKSPLDSTASDIGKNGSFELKVDASKPTYTTTYCAAEYIPRADRDLRNEKDGSPVVPIPVEVLKRDTDTATYTWLIRKKTIGILSDLSYLETFDPKMYNAVMETLIGDFQKISPNRAELLHSFKNLVHYWNQ